MNPPKQTSSQRHHERGNMLFIILIAVALLATLTAVIVNSSNTESANIDDETALIRASEVQRYASDIERGIGYILQNGYSESDIRFAHPDAPSEYGDLSADGDPGDQAFHASGGAANYSNPPSGVQSSASEWEFYGNTAIPNVGSDAADLIMVLPNVTQQFCAVVNSQNNQSATPEDTAAGGCIDAGSSERFTGSFDSSPNTPDETTFEQNDSLTPSIAYPALQACVQCLSDSSYHFYHVLLAR